MTQGACQYMSAKVLICCVHICYDMFHTAFSLDSWGGESEKAESRAKGYLSEPMGRGMAVRKDGRGKPEPLLLTVGEAARLLRVSRNLAYELVAQGRLPHIRLGSRILIPRRGLEEWIAQEAGLPQPLPPVVSFGAQRH